MGSSKTAMLLRSLFIASASITLFLLLILGGMILFPSESLWFYVALQRGYLLRNLGLAALAIITVMVPLHLALSLLYERIMKAQQRANLSDLKVPGPCISSKQSPHE